MPLIKFAMETAVGQIAKERCQDNYKIIRQIYNSLPPEEALNDIQNIKRLLDRFGERTINAELSLRLINDCSIYLGNLKEKNLDSHASYIALTTQIVRKALNSIIGDVNKSLERVKNSGSFAHYSESNKAKQVLKTAWEATLCLGILPVQEETKNWYKKTRETLKGILDNAGINATSNCGFSILTEPERFRNCKTKEDYENYLKLYNAPRYAELAKTRIQYYERKEEEERLRRQNAERLKKEADAALCHKIEQCSSLEQLWPLYAQCDSVTTLNAFDHRAWNLCHNRKDYKSYIEHLPNGKHKNEAIKKARSLIEKICNYVKLHKGWTIFISTILVVLTLIGLIWGPEGYQVMLYVIGAIGVFAAWGGLSSALKDGRDVGTDLIVLLIGGVVAVVCFVGANAMDDYVRSYSEKRELARIAKMEDDAYTRFKNNPTEENFKGYLKDYRHGKYIDEVVNQYILNVREKGPLALSSIANDYPVLAEETGINDLISLQCDSLYSIAESIGTRQGWENYQKSVPTDQLRDSDVQIENIDNREWNTESKAWAKANDMGTLAGYYKYTNLYPKGSHYSQANKKIIDLEVDQVMAGEHGDLPALDQVGYGYGPTSNICIYNNTTYTLTLSYSGSDSKRILISPHEKRSIKLKNGKYRCVASVNGGGVSNHAGIENLTGGSYEVEYYISTYRTRY